MKTFLDSPLKPSAIKPTEVQHQLAYRKFLLQSVDEDLYRIDMYRSNPERARVPWEDLLDKLLNGLFRNENPVDDDDDDDLHPWVSWRPYAKWKEGMLEDLASPHGGDCTSVPATCSRCYAEEFYGFPSTVTWSKAEGWALINDLREREKLAAFNRETHYISKKDWSTKAENVDWQLPSMAEQRAWNIRTNGSGDLSTTLLYSLRAHMRGKIHCMASYEEQAEFLRRNVDALPMRLLTEREPHRVAA